MASDYQRFPSKPDCLRVLLAAGLEPKTVIDVGVHSGTPELIEAFPDAHHLLIEPEPAHFSVIAETYRDVAHTLIPLGASDRHGAAALTTEHGETGGEVTHSRFLDNDPATEPDTAMVKVAPLDAIVSQAGLEGPYFLKIDTDGHELAVLAGAAETLKQSAAVAIEAVTDSVSARMAPIEAAGLRLFDIVDLAYYERTLWQMDLVFVNPAVFDPPALRPQTNPASNYAAWHAHRPPTPPPAPPPPPTGLRRIAMALARRLPG
ncbi:MAG: FkbM family methyltransferase [Alphaproteobacteria bacterium]|nr:FkbM family methyltransferase [Alphaproteobacteria bacterium]